MSLRNGTYWSGGECLQRSFGTACKKWQKIRTGYYNRTNSTPTKQPITASATLVGGWGLSPTTAIDLVGWRRKIDDKSWIAGIG